MSYIGKDYTKERTVLSQIYANKANSIKYLPFFFKDRKELRRFFNFFGGKTLVLPDTFEEFVEGCLYVDSLPDNDCKRGIDSKIHDKIKDKIINTYLNLYDTFESVIRNELNTNTTNKKRCQ